MASSFLGILPPDDILQVMQHPAQQHNVMVVAELIRQLHWCRTSDQYDDFQRILFRCLYDQEAQRTECRRCASRLVQGRSLPTPLPQLPNRSNPNDPETWRIEDLVLDRICRQLRAVGDGLAWRASGYDRRYVIALSSNDYAGPMAGKSGLPAELGAAIEMRNMGSFGLLHDLTNCLRIADITEFKPDGSKLLYEIKSSPTARRGPQRKRMKAAVEAVMTGGELPGRPGHRIVAPEVHCRTHMRKFATGIDLAFRHGIAGTSIPYSRALTAISFPTLGQTRAGGLLQQFINDVNVERQRVIDEARIEAVRHHVRVSSVTRNHDFHQPSVMPFALFPLPPIQAALLICDFLILDITFAPGRLADELQTFGFTSEIPLATANDNLIATDTVISLRKGPRNINLHPGALYELLIECLDLRAWAAAISGVLEDSRAPRHPVFAFSTTRVWR